MDCFTPSVPRLLRIWFALLVGLCLGAPGCEKRVPAPMPPNILFILVDSLRADWVGPGKPGQLSTPALDTLTRQGAYFTQAIAQASWTVPSVFSIVTGQNPYFHGIHTWDSALPHRTGTLMSRLRAAGYRTGLLTTHPGLSDGTGFGRLFDKASVARARTDNEVTTQAERWFARNQQSPFFLWLHYMETHNSTHRTDAQSEAKRRLSPSEMQTYLARYNAGVRRMDAHLKTLRQSLHANGLAERTILCLTADHGEAMCEHEDCFIHGGSLFDPLIRVPLLLLDPRSSNAARSIPDQVQHVDLAPTLLALAGIRSPSLGEGRSLVPLLRGQPLPPRPALSMHLERETEMQSSPWVYTLLGIRTPHWKLIDLVSQHERLIHLFDLVNDPREQTPIFDRGHAEARKLAVSLDAWKRRPVRPKPPQGKIQLDPRTRMMLESLGYLQ